MFTDEIGDDLVAVKKYDEAEPIVIPENSAEESENIIDDGGDVTEIYDVDENFNNVDNVRYIDPMPRMSTTRRLNLNMKVFGNPNIKKSQSFNTFREGFPYKNLATKQSLSLHYKHDQWAASVTVVTGFSQDTLLKDR